MRLKKIQYKNLTKLTNFTLQPLIYKRVVYKKQLKKLKIKDFLCLYIKSKFI